MKSKNLNIASVVVVDVVNLSYQAEFEDWQKRINTEITKTKGFISISSRKTVRKKNEYLTFYQFDSSETLQRWLKSEKLKQYLEEAKQYTLIPAKLSLHQGLEIFFESQDSNKNQIPYYKKVLLGIMAVYPLIIIVGKIYRWIIPSFAELPFEVTLIFEVIMVSALLTYPVMPFLTKRLHRWLY